MLVNRQHAIPEDFIPNLTPTAQRPEIRLDIAACAALERMMEAAEEDGHTIIIASGYRDRSYQEDLLQEDIASAIGRGMSCEEAYRYVVRETMPPGCSEHETGLAADLVSPSNQVLDERQADTAGEQMAPGTLRGIRIYSALSGRQRRNHRSQL